MRTSSCQIEFGNGGNAIRCGGPVVAECADCGSSICSGCRTECCGESFCDYCYAYHVAHPGCDIARVEREEIRTPLSSHLLARGPGLEPGTTLGTFDLIEAHSPYLGWLNDSPAFRAESVH